MKTRWIMIMVLVALCGMTQSVLAALTATVIPSAGPFVGGNRVVITNATGSIGSGNNITNITVGGVNATGFATSQGATWVSFITPATGSAGAKDIVIQSATIGTTTLTGKYTVNPAGEIGAATQDWTRWDEVAPLPVQYGRYSLAAAVLNGSLYVMGGYAPGGTKTNVYKYNGTVWSEVAGLPMGVGSATAATLNGALYSVGGATITNVYRYDETNWTQVAGLPAARQMLAAATLNGAMYSVGGYNSGAKTNVYKYNGTNWTQVAGLPKTRWCHTATTLNSALYSVGGHDGALTTTNVYKYNGTVWSEVVGLPIELETHAADVLNGALYVVGGVTNHSTMTDVSTVYKYDGTSWTTVASLPVTRHYHTVSTLNGSLYSVGGISGPGGGATTNVFRYPAVVAGVSTAPSSGSYTGGYQVVINGANLGSGTDITNVTLCGISASIQSQSATQIVVAAGAAAAVTLGDVCVYSTSFGATLRTSAFTYTYPPPSIASQPVGAVVAVGQPASLSVTAGGIAPFGYQWLRNGAILPGQTNATLTYSSFQFTNSGSVSVVVSNLGGLAISLPASLSIPNAPLKGWGYNGAGQLRNASQSQTLPITLASNVVTMAAGDTHSLFVTSDSTLWGMGDNTYGPGELGLGALSSTTVPMVVASNVVAVTAGTGNSFFIKADGTLWGMGNNTYGSLGNGTFTSAGTLPIFVASNVVVAVVGQYNSLFVKADGTLWGMGLNGSGQLGIGTTANTNLPTYVTNNVVAVAAGSSHSLFMRADGSVWGMGDNSQGQFGLGNNTTPQIRPVYVTNNVVSIAVGSSHSMFVKTDGTLWNTGYNANGELGSGTLIATNRLTYVTNNVVTAIGGNRHSLFMKADGSLWTMGWNYYGTLGNGTSGNTKHTNAAAVKGGLLAASLANNSGCLNYHCLAIAGAAPVVGTLTNRTVLAGQPTVFTASVASGDGPFTYQWQKIGTNILNATNAVLTIGSAALTDAGSYAVLVSSTYGTISTNAVLTVNKASQTITFSAISDKVATDTVGLTATASSGLTASFSVLSGLASISDGTNLTFSGAGSVSIVVSQAGDGSYNAAPNVTNSFTVHGIPAVGTVTLQRATNQILKVTTTTLLGNTTDPEGSALSVVWLSPGSTNGGSVTLAGRWVTYTPPAGNNTDDFFQFRVRNAFGGEAVGTAKIETFTQTSGGSQTLNFNAASVGGNAELRIFGIPGRTYIVQGATQLVEPNWTNLSGCVIGVGGYVDFTETSPPSPRFYRTVKP